MLTAYVRHYLTDAGICYFQENWFPNLEVVIQQQPGFVSLVYSMNPQVKDQIDIILKFVDQASLNAWADLPIHDQFIADLDRYRSRDYWEVVLTEDEGVDPISLEWMRIDCPIEG